MENSRVKLSDNEQLYLWYKNFALRLEYIHWKILIDLVGLAKANKICIDVWRNLTVSSWRKAKNRVNLKSVKNFEDFKKVVKESIPKCIDWQIYEENPDSLRIWYTDCPWYTFVQNEISDNDRPSYIEWLIEAQRQNCLVRIEESGLGNISGKATKFMCTGDKYCELVYKKT